MPNLPNDDKTMEDSRWDETDVETFLSQNASATPQEQCTLLVAELTRHRLTSDGPSLETVLDSLPDVAGDPSLKLQVVTADFASTRARDPDVTIATYIARFPDLEDGLRRWHAAETQMTLQTPGSSQPGISGVYAPGETFGDYVIEGEIARGGMGVVFRARQISLNRLVALKMILASHLAGEEAVRRFQAEAESAGRLDHPGIVPIYDVGEFNGQHYFSMGLVEGDSLDGVARQGVSNRRAAELVHTIAMAVQYAHTRNIVHRDLKPANVLLDAGGQPKVTDFGLAKNIEEDSGLTATGAVMGTPAFMAPEQAAGKLDEIGPLADVYALGGILFFLLTGRPPFQGTSAIDTIQNVLGTEASSPRQFNAEVDLDLATICLKCLEKDPSRRYASAAALADELQLFLDGRPITARPVGQFERGWRWCKRNKAMASLTVMATVSLLAGTIVSCAMAVLANERADVAIAEQQRADENAAKFRSAMQRAELETDRANKKQAQLAAGQAELKAKNEELLTAEALARDEAANANALSAFLTGVLAETDPIALSGRTFGVRTNTSGRTIEDVVQIASDQVDVSFPERSKVRATVLHTLGNVWISYGNTDAAAKMLSEALEIRRELLPARHKDVVASVHGAGRVASYGGRLKEAHALYEQALLETRALLQESAAPHAQRELETLLADILWDLGVLRAGRDGDLEDWQSPLEESLKLRERLFGPESRQACMSLVALAQAHLITKEDKVTGLMYLRQAMAALDKLRGQKLFTMAGQKLINAQIMLTFGNLTAAEASFREGLSTLEKALGGAHVGVAFVRRQFGHFLYFEKEDYPAAKETWIKVNKEFQAIFGPEHPECVDTLVYLSFVYVKLEKFEEARDTTRRAVDICLAHKELDPKLLITALRAWGEAYDEDATHEAQKDGILLGPAWQAGLKANEQILEIIAARVKEPSSDAENQLKWNRRQVSFYTERTDYWTKFALGQPLCWRWTPARR